MALTYTRGPTTEIRSLRILGILSSLNTTLAPDQDTTGIVLITTIGTLFYMRTRRVHFFSVPPALEASYTGQRSELKQWSTPSSQPLV